MVRLTTNGSKTLPDVISVSDYLSAIERAEEIKAKATSFEDYPTGYITSIDVAQRLIESGLTAWDTPKFYRHLRLILSGMYRDGRFEIARFVARFLLESLPEDPLDRDIIEYLRSIHDGTRNLPPFDSYCKFPKEPEYYLKTLNWRMVELAEDGKRFAQAERQTFRAMRKMGRGKEYLDSKNPIASQ